MTRLKTKLRKKYWNRRDMNDWVAYKSIRNVLNREVWKAKKSYFADRLSNCKDPKEFWRTLKQGGVTCGKGNNNIPPDDDINELNKYFADMGQAKDIDENELEYFRTHRMDGIGEGMRFRMVTEEEVKNAMNGVKSRAVGTDQLSIDMIKTKEIFQLLN